MTPSTNYSRGETFPVLDADRRYADTEYGRHIIAEVGCVEPYIGETDYWATLPLRVVIDAAAGPHIECGPYSLDAADIRALQAAIRAYHEVFGQHGLRVIAGGATP